MKHETYKAKNSESVKAEFICDVPLTIHWYGKLLEDITAENDVEKLPVLISGYGVD